MNKGSQHPRAARVPADTVPAAVTVVLVAKVARAAQVGPAVRAIDYKRADILSQFVQERGKILPRRMTGVCARHQRWLGEAIKRARNIALLPFAGSAAGSQAPRPAGAHAQPGAGSHGAPGAHAPAAAASHPPAAPAAPAAAAPAAPAPTEAPKS
jgi:ribosomal protein S18